MDSATAKGKVQGKKSWKGVSEKTVSVLTYSDGAACGYYFVKGESYLVYAYGKARLTTGVCTRTSHLSLAQRDLIELDHGAFPLRGKLVTTWANLKSSR